MCACISSPHNNLLVPQISVCHVLRLGHQFPECRILWTIRSSPHFYSSISWGNQFLFVVRMTFLGLISIPLQQFSVETFAVSSDDLQSRIYLWWVHFLCTRIFYQTLQRFWIYSLGISRLLHMPIGIFWYSYFSQVMKIVHICFFPGNNSIW